ncbi:MAG: serine hydrolase [Pyrinomonadaceae bacterium]|nr:serine hydrolase [Pyrinomonadaceae bacterium]
MKTELTKFKIISVILLLFISTGLAFGQNVNLQSIDDYVNKSIKDWEVPGVAIAVVKDDKIVFAKGYGVRELGKTDAVTTNTMFAIGSSSKAFTSAALAMLVDEGKIKWNDPVSKYLPSFQLFDPYVTREMMVRDLLSHRIGLERGDRLWYATDFSRDEVMRRIRFLKPSSSFRSRFGYQNIMYLAGGQIIPSVVGKSWDDFLKERIFTPLGMSSTNTSISGLKGMPDVASPHAKINDKVKPVAYRLIDNIGPAGSINSNVTDMAQWVRMQLNSGKYGDKQIVSAANIKEMQNPHTIIPLEGLYTSLYSEAHFLSYGMGWFLSDYRGRKMVEHGGAIDGMRAAVMMIPEEKMGVIVLGNMNGSILPQLLGNRIFDAYLFPGKEKDWSGDLLKVIKAAEAQAKTAQQKIETDRAKDTKPSLSLENYAGNYTDEMYGDMKVTFENGKLKAKFGTYFNGILEHWHFDTFRVKWEDEMQGEGFISFKLNSQGKVDTMNIEGLAEFKRAPDKK